MNKTLSYLALNFLFLNTAIFAMNRVVPNEYSQALARNHAARVTLRNRYNQPGQPITWHCIIEPDNTIKFYYEDTYQSRQKIAQKTFCSMRDRYYFTFDNGLQRNYNFPLIDHNIEIKDEFTQNYTPCRCGDCIASGEKCCTIC